MNRMKKSLVLFILMIFSLTGIPAGGQSLFPLLNDESKEETTETVLFKISSGGNKKAFSYSNFAKIPPIVETTDPDGSIRQEYFDVSEADISGYEEQLERKGYSLTLSEEREGVRSLNAVNSGTSFSFSWYPEQFRLSVKYPSGISPESMPLHLSDIRWLTQSYGLKEAYALLYKGNYGKIAAGFSHLLGVRSDGTVVGAGTNEYGNLKVEKWRDIIAVSAGNFHSVGLKSDGTVIACGIKESSDYGQTNVSGWTDIVAVSAGASHTVGLKSNGTVLAAGNNSDGQCNVSSWTDIVAISAGYNHTAGLKSDGSVVVAGFCEYGNCSTENWRDITAVSASRFHVYGITGEKTVLVAGTPPIDKPDQTNNFGQGAVYSWENIIDISSLYLSISGLKSDGTVISLGRDSGGLLDTSDWRNVTQISQGGACTVGLLPDGTVLSVGRDECLAGIEKWSNIGN